MYNQDDIQFVVTHIHVCTYYAHVAQRDNIYSRMQSHSKMFSINFTCQLVARNVTKYDTADYIHVHCDTFQFGEIPSSKYVKFQKELCRSYI